MAATKTPRPDIRFIVDVNAKSSSDSQRLKLTVTPVVIEEGKLRNPSFGWSDNTGAGEYEGLRIEGQCDKTDADFYFGTEVIEFDIYRVTPRRAEALVKTCRRLQKSFDRQNDKWGYFKDSADVLARLADAVGCTDRYCFGRATSNTGWSYDDNNYQWMNVEDLRRFLAKEVTAWKEAS